MRCTVLGFTSNLATVLRTLNFHVPLHPEARTSGRAAHSCVKNNWYCNSQRQRATQHQWLSARVQRGANSAKCNSSRHRNGARPVQGLLERLTLALGILVPPLPGAGKLGTASDCPSITLAFASAARSASISLINSIDCSICSVVIALMPPECSTCSSRGTRYAQTFKYAAGCCFRTLSIAAASVLFEVGSEREQEVLVERSTCSLQ